MKLRGIQFGYPDAEDEYENCPDLFDYAFYDPKNHIDALLNGNKFLICGRKGDGKTAYCSKMKRLADADRKLQVTQRSFDLVDSALFETLANKDRSGGIRYFLIWKCILLIELIKMISECGFSHSSTDYRLLVDALKNAGLLSNNAIQSTIRGLSDIKLSLTIKGFGVEGRRIRERKLNGAEDIYTCIFGTLKDLYFSVNTGTHKENAKFYLILDGLDDVLRSMPFNPGIITGLIRAAHDLNKNFMKVSLHFKIIILIREDVLALCRDPDMNKLKPFQIPTTWAKEDDNYYNSDLAGMALLRFREEQALTDGDFSTIWKNIFPAKFYDTDSFEYFLKYYSLFRPRDLLQFLSQAQILYPDNDQITVEEFRKILYSYSENYFVDEMKDDLTGSLKDETISQLPNIFLSMRETMEDQRRFQMSDFEAACQSYVIANSPSEILGALFERGYIGQFRKKPRKGAPDYERPVFKYINKTEPFIASDDCYIHRGLIRAFNM